MSSKKYLIDEKLPDDYCSNPPKEFTLRGHQKFAIEKFQNKRTKGLLVYYEMGSGKTLISLELAKILNKKTYLITQPILNNNFKNEMKKFGYTFEYTFIDVETIEKGNYDFDNSFVIIDECHLFFYKVINSRIDAYYNLDTAANCDILLLTGTPIFVNPFELSAMFNLISGREILPRSGKKFNLNYYNDISYGIYRKNTFKRKIEGLVLYFPGYVDNIHVFPKKEKVKFVWHGLGKAMKKDANDYNRVLNFPEKPTLENVKYYSPKLHYMLKFIEEHPGEKIMIYTSFDEVIRMTKEVLSLKYEYEKDFLIASDDDIEVINKFNADKNIRVIITNAKYGISLMGVRHVHVLESPESATDFNQIIARATRLCSHTEYEPKRRNVYTYLHVNYSYIFSSGIDYNIFYKMYIYYCLISDFEKTLREASIGPVIEQ